MTPETRPEHRDGFRKPLRFPTPATPREAEDRVLYLQQGIGEIDAQLADRNRRSFETGERLSDHAYHGWRRAAVSAKMLKTAELRFLRHWLRRRSEAHVSRRSLVDLILALGKVDGYTGTSDALAGVHDALEAARKELGL
jgi:hypothetical protein